MPYRVRLLQDIVMNLDGQTQIVLSGSVIDVPDSMRFHSSHIQRLSPGEAAGALHPGHGKPTSVRNIRKPKG